MNRPLCIYILLLPFFLFGQNRTIDSLKLALKNAKHDTTRCNILGALAETASDDEWPKFNEQLKLVAEAALKKLPPTHPQYSLFKKHVATSLDNIGLIYYNQGDIPKALEYYGKSLKIQEEVGDKKGIAASLNNIGLIYGNQGDPSVTSSKEDALRAGIPKALECYGRSLKIREETRLPDGQVGDKSGIAVSLNNIGLIYYNQGDIRKALENYSRSLKIYEEIGDKSGIAVSLNNIGLIYYNQGDILKALEYFGRSLKIYEEMGDKSGIANSLNNIGSAYKKQGDIPKVLEYHGRSLKLREEIGDKQGIAQSLNNIGLIYHNQGDIPKALEYHGRSLKIQEEIGDNKGVAYSLNNIGGIYFKQKDYSKALEYCNKSMKVSKDLGYPENISNAAEKLSKIHKAVNNHKLALENYELYIQMRDSISNESTRKASIKQQLKHEYETKAAADSVAHAKESEIKNAELAKQKAEISAKKNQQYALFGGLFAVCVFGVFMFNRYKVTQKQKGIIEEQKAIVEEQKLLVEHKQKEILDSIHYAKRIQLAQIPNEKQVFSMLKRMKGHEGK